MLELLNHKKKKNYQLLAHAQTGSVFGGDRVGSGIACAVGEVAGGKRLAGGFEVVEGEAELLQVIDALGAPGGLARACTAGRRSAISRPMMAIDTRSSTSVKPIFRGRAMAKLLSVDAAEVRSNV